MWRLVAIVVVIVLLVLNNSHESKEFEQINTKLDIITKAVPLPRPKPHRKPSPRICCPYVKPID